MAQQQAARRNWEHFDFVGEEPEDVELLTPAVASGVDHARAFQQRLFKAYEPSPGDRNERKLPIGQRVAVIIGLTCALWMMVGVGIVSLLYLYSLLAS
ncbi:hypothetical protein [Novosphingobium sp. 9U]|uniref:hypothetical protein n=1 Tax=Novosphingobium sp. 9U TaxID=2653158 RepID=UPI0012F33352|nr:hypothetical protein [Novosphingobium sp. 9U]VWX52755.1 hypothetical protein NOVOSPHI9U_410002 [Novosphingobium sp. 9U]